MRKPRASLLVLLSVGLVGLALAVATSGGGGGNGLAALQGPSWDHLLGTDRLGRDVVTITLVGAARSLGWATVSLACSAVGGLALGLLSVTHWESVVDETIQIVAESIRSFPSIVAALLFLAFGVPIPFLMAVYFWVPIWRVVRAQLGAQRLRPYVLNVTLFGHSRYWALARHAFPNASAGMRGVLFVAYAEIVSVQAGLEFLGFSTPLSTPTLGNIVSEAMRLGAPYARVWMPAALLASVVTIGLFILGQRYAIRQAQGLE